jgi:hypothetical protein
VEAHHPLERRIATNLVGIWALQVTHNNSSSKISLAKTMALTKPVEDNLQDNLQHQLKATKERTIMGEIPIKTLPSGIARGTVETGKGVGKSGYVRSAASHSQGSSCVPSAAHFTSIASNAKQVHLPPFAARL